MTEPATRTRLGLLAFLVEGGVVVSSAGRAVINLGPNEADVHDAVRELVIAGWARPTDEGVYELTDLGRQIFKDGLP
jgi:hypothetical protein